MFNLCIVIPCYNEGGFFLKKDYTSFLEKFKDTLICVVNDGSTDNTQDYINALKNEFPKNVEVVTHSNNQMI